MDQLGQLGRERDGHGRGDRGPEGRQGHDQGHRGRQERERHGDGHGRAEAADDGVVQAIEDGQAGHGVLARVHEPELDRQREDGPGVRRLVEGDRARHEGRADRSRVRAGRQVVRQQRRQAVRGQGRHTRRDGRQDVVQGSGLQRVEAADDGVVQAIEDGQAGHGVLARVHEPELDRQREDGPGVRRLVEGDRARHEGRADRSRVRAGRQVVRQQRRQAVRGQGRHARRGRRPVNPGRHTKLRDNHQTIIK